MPPLLAGGVVTVLFILLFTFVGLHANGLDFETTALGRDDHWTHTVPGAYFLDVSIHSGTFPLWQPLVFNGMPFAANPLSLTFYPPNIVRSVLTFNPTPLNTSTGLFVLTAVHLLLAAISTYAFGRTLRLSRPASFVAALGYAFSAYFLSRSTVHVWLNLMVAWVPLVMLLTHFALTARTRRQRIVWTLAAGLALGMCLLVGFMQMAFYIGVLVAGYAALHLLGRVREIGVVWCAERAALVAVLLLVAGGAALALLYPASELSGFSGRAKDAGLEVTLTPVELEYTPLRVLKLLTVYPGLGEFRDIMASGCVVLMLAAAALASNRYWGVTTFALLTLAMLDCCLGYPFPVSTLIDVIAPFEFPDVPRAAILLCLPLAILAGFGVDAITDRAQRGAVHHARWAISVVCGGALTYLLFATVQGDFFLSPHWTVVAAPAAAVVLLGAARWLPAQTPWRVGFAALAAIEIAAWNSVPTPFPYGEESLYSGAMEPLDQAHAFSLENRRGITDKPNVNVYTLSSVMNGYDSVHVGEVGTLLRKPENERIYNRQVLRECVTDNHRGNLLFKRKFWLSRQYVAGPLPPHDRLFPAATTAFLTDPPPLPLPQISPEELETSSVTQAGRTFRQGDASALTGELRYTRGEGKQGPNIYVQFPLMDKPAKHSALILHVRSHVTAQAHLVITEWLSGGVKGDQSYLHTLDLRADAGNGQTFELPLPEFRKFELGMNVINVETVPPFDVERIGIATDTLDEDQSIEMTSFGPNHVNVRVNEIPGPRVLTYLDAYYPGWLAFVDDKPVPILRSAQAFKAVLVPSGTHDVRFEFRPPKVYMGMLVSVGTIIAVAITMIYLTLTERSANS